MIALRSGGSLGLLGLGLVGGLLLGGRGAVLDVAGPQRKVVAEELHDEGRVLVALLAERVELGNGIVKRLLGKVARAVGRVENLIVEDAEVERETEADRVGRCEIGLGNVRGLLVRVVSRLGGTCEDDEGRANTVQLPSERSRPVCTESYGEGHSPFLESPEANSARYRW